MQALQRRFLTRNDMADSMVLTAIFLAAAYWGIEALINLFSPGEISFYREIFGPNVGGMGMRVIVLCLFLIFGSHVQFTINNRKRAEQALKESEEKYRRILESIEEGYYEVDHGGNFTFVNDATHQILGVAKAELSGRNMRQFLIAESNRKLFEAFQECLRAGRSVKAFDIELLRGDAVLFIEASAGLRKNQDGEAIGFRGMLRDRTEKKKLEMDLLESYRKVQNARAATILGLAKLAEYRDEGTGTHLERIREYARLLAAEMARQPGHPEFIDQRYIDDIYNSAILHDIGKVGIPDAVLLKPGELTHEEFEVIKCHTRFGGDALSAIEAQIEGRSFLHIGKEIAYNHHEKWDGSGYPAGLKGQAIPLAARIVAVADVYDALTTRRLYKEAFSHAKARQIILNLRGTHFDPGVVDAFSAIEGQFDRIRQEKLKQERKTIAPVDDECYPGSALLTAAAS
ncbi:MAG: PAS domain S-box protein [Deltaproteobacteria bacterium]|nr:PAS domain S-box protein [Deltaproteobacteria bacterium]